MTSDVKMVKYWGRGLQVDDSTLLLDRVFIFWSHQEVFDGGTYFKVHLHSMFAANLLCALTQPSVIWNYYIWILVVVGTRSGSVVFLFVMGWVPCLDFDSFESPCRIFAFSECPV